MPTHLTTCQTFLDEVLTAVYGEVTSLVGGRVGPPASRRQLEPHSTERALVARMAHLGERTVRKHFPAAAVVDVEYERVGTTAGHKQGWDGGKISPDLIVHERANLAGNYLAVEVKRCTVPRTRAWEDGNFGPDAHDLAKLAFMTHLSQLLPPNASYHWGAYVELDRNGADIWWLEGDSMQFPAPVVPENVTQYQRWHRP